MAVCRKSLELRKIRGLFLKGFIVDRVFLDIWKNGWDGRMKVDFGISNVAHLGEALDDPGETRSAAGISPPALFDE